MASLPTAVEGTAEFWQAVLDYLSSAEGKLSRAFVRAVRSAQEGFDTERVSALIQNGEYDAAVSLVLGTGTGDAALFIGLRIAVAEVALLAATSLASGKLALGTIQPLAHLDTLAPEVVHAIRTATMSTVQGITAETQVALRDVLTTYMSAGAHPYDAAIQMRDALGLTTRDAKAALNFRRELEAGDKSALNRALRDKRGDHALVHGTELKADQIDSRVAAYERRLLKHRAETVAITEAARALNIGASVAWSNAFGGVGSFVRRRWIVAPDERTCTACIETAATNAGGVLPNQPFATPYGPVAMPPLHPRCRCMVTYELDLAAAVTARVTGQ